MHMWVKVCLEQKEMEFVNFLHEWWIRVIRVDELYCVWGGIYWLKL